MEVEIFGDGLGCHGDEQECGEPVSLVLFVPGLIGLILIWCIPRLSLFHELEEGIENEWECELERGVDYLEETCGDEPSANQGLDWGDNGCLVLVLLLLGLPGIVKDRKDGLAVVDGGEGEQIVLFECAMLFVEVRSAGEERLGPAVSEAREDVGGHLG